MKKFILLFAIPVYLFACKDHDKPPANSCDCDSLTTEQIKKIPIVDSATAYKMRQYYHDMHHQIDSNIIQMITMSGSRLRKLLYHQKAIRLLTAAYLDSNETHKKGDVTMLIQFWPNEGNMYYFDMMDAFGIANNKTEVLSYKAGICPLPIDCQANRQPSE